MASRVSCGYLVLDMAGLRTNFCNPPVTFIPRNLFNGYLERVPIPTERRFFLSDDDVIRRTKSAQVDLLVRQYHYGAILDVNDDLPSSFGRVDSPFLNGAKIGLFPPTKREAWIDMKSYSISSVL